MNRNDKKIAIIFTVLFVLLEAVVYTIIFLWEWSGKSNANSTDCTTLVGLVFTTIMVACCFLPLSITIRHYAKLAKMKILYVIFSFIKFACSVWLLLSVIVLILRTFVHLDL